MLRKIILVLAISTMICTKVLQVKAVEAVSKNPIASEKTSSDDSTEEVAKDDKDSTKVIEDDSFVNYDIKPLFDWRNLKEEKKFKAKAVEAVSKNPVASEKTSGDDSTEEATKDDKDSTDLISDDSVTDLGLGGLFNWRNLKGNKNIPKYKKVFNEWNRDLAEADRKMRKLAETGSEDVVDPTTEPAAPTETEPVVESPGFQYQPNSGNRVPLWPALCKTKYHGDHWGKSDGTHSYFTWGSKSYLCPQDSQRDDVSAVEFKLLENVSPCPNLMVTDARGLKWAPVLVRTTFGEIPGQVRYFEDSGKTREKGVFAYMGKSYQGPIMAWLC